MADQAGSRLPDDPTTAWYAEHWDTLAVPGASVTPASYRITAERWYQDGGYISPVPIPDDEDVMAFARSARWYRDPQAVALTVLLVLAGLAAGVSFIL